MLDKVERNFKEIVEKPRNGLVKNFFLTGKGGRWAKPFLNTRHWDAE